MLNLLITGANGQLGNEMRKRCSEKKYRCTYTDVAELDLTNRSAVVQLVTELRPDFIINCAAYTNVERAEEDEATALKINGDAVANLGYAAQSVQAKVIHVSTDYVFDGNASKPYTEEHPTAPLAAYGRTKLRGEQSLEAANCSYIILRTAWLYSPYGNNFVKTMRRLTSERAELNVVFDQVGTPTYAGDLAQAILAIIDQPWDKQNEGIYHFSNEGVCSWYDFAHQIALLSGNTACKIHPCHSDEFPSKVHRPNYSVLDKSKIKKTFGIEIQHWQTALAQCLEQLNKE